MELGCWTDFSGERPLTLDIGGLKTTSLLEERPMRGVWSVNAELIRSQEDGNGIFAVSEAELGSWNIFRRRVDAIDDEGEPCLQYLGLILDALRHVNMDY